MSLGRPAAVESRRVWGDGDGAGVAAVAMSAKVTRTGQAEVCVLLLLEDVK